MNTKMTIAAGFALSAAQAVAFAACPKSEAAIKALDAEYQAAVQKNDAEAIDRLLPDDFALVTGKGKVIGKTDLLAEARVGEIVYQRQDDSRQTVRFFDDIVVITALLHAKGSERGKPFDYRLWFSDVYLCTPDGWRYTFAQSSIALPD